LYYVRKAVSEIVRVLKREVRILPGELDLDELPKLLDKDDPLILDIGANDGSHTLEFLRLFSQARVCAFEPDQRALERFRAKVKSERVRHFDLAISDIDGTAEFHVSDGLPPGDEQSLRPGGWDLSGSIRKPKEHLVTHPWCTFNETITVKTKRLDTWCREEGIESIDLIWADVQGAEENLIRGGTETLRRTRFLYTEYSDRELYEGQISLGEIRALLPNFEVLYRFDNDVLLKNRDRN
jgi:2-O-methyltransferase